MPPFDDTTLGTALSRMSPPGGPQLIVCQDCGEREWMARLGGVAPVPPEKWPLSVDAVLEEDRVRWTLWRRILLGTPDDDQHDRESGRP